MIWSSLLNLALFEGKLKVEKYVKLHSDINFGSMALLFSRHVSLSAKILKLMFDIFSVLVIVVQNVKH